MTTFIVLSIYFIGMIPSYIMSMKRSKYVIDKYDGYNMNEFESEQYVGVAIFTTLSWIGIPLLGVSILVIKFGKFLNKIFHLD